MNTLKAYSITYSRIEGYLSDTHRSQWYLPRVKCDTCEQAWRALGKVPPVNWSTWSETEVWYPAFSLLPDADTKMFRREKTVTAPEIEVLRTKVLGLGVERASLLPGSGIGTVHVRLPKAAPDFVKCCFKWLASCRAIEILWKSGVEVPYGPALVKVAKSQLSDKYVALQLDPVPLYSSKTLAEETLDFCPICSNMWMNNVRAEPKGDREFVLTRINEKEGLTKVRESYSVLATPQFIDVVRRHKLTGLDFNVAGVYV